MSIKITQPGILTTVQDLGRNGFRRLGINPNGAMDRTAARIANLILGNDPNDAVIEMHYPAAEIEFETETVFALCGANFSARLDGSVAENWRPHQAKPGSALKFRERVTGFRSYLAVRGGFELDKRLDSASTNLRARFGGFEGRQFRKGDSINLRLKSSKIGDDEKNFTVSPNLIPRYSRFPTVRVIAGAEFELLTALGQEIFLKHEFTVSLNSDRMGFKLQGQPIYLLNEKEMTSSAVDFGTVQLLPDGQLVVLMADHQTSGGYPRIAHVVETDLPLVAQLGPNDRLSFHVVSHEDAENIVLSHERDLNFLRIGCNFALK